MKRFVLFVLLALSLSSCASSPRYLWVEQEHGLVVPLEQNVTNTELSRIGGLRLPTQTEAFAFDRLLNSCKASSSYMRTSRYGTAFTFVNDEVFQACMGASGWKFSRMPEAEELAFGGTR